MAVGNFFGGEFFGGGFFGVNDTATTGGGTSKRRKRARKPVIRFSDFESRDAYEAALQPTINPVSEVIEAPPDDDDLILLIARVLH